MTSNLDIALTYAHLGVSVIPCRETKNDRAGVKAPYVTGGLHSASAEKSQIQTWWRTWPYATIGLPCRFNEIIVIDADRHGEEDGVATLLKLCAQHSFDSRSVPCVETPGNGLHLIFRRPVKPENTVGRLCLAVDVRDNAYVIAAGSLMPDGRQYVLQNGSVDMLAAAVSGRSLPLTPHWLIAALTRPPLVAQPMVSPQSRVLHPINVVRRLEGLVRSVVNASAGQRNNTLHWAACRAGEMVSARIISRDAATSTLFEAGIRAGLSRREVTATLKSGLSQGYVVARP